MHTLPHVEALCALPDPYPPDDRGDALFDAALRELALHHADHTPGYGDWLARHGIGRDRLRQPIDVFDLPPIFASYFKRRPLLAPSGHDAPEFTSSGTTGQRSRMRYDARSLQAAQAMVDRVFAHFGWHTPHQPCNYLILGYEPEGAGTLGTARTDAFLCRYAPARRVFHALRHDGRRHAFDAWGTVRTLQAYADEGLPVRLIGFPAFLWFTLRQMQQRRLPALRLAPGSLVFLGGGWKTHAHEEIPQAELRARVAGQLGIADDRCRDGYGAVEHPVPYIDCPNHRFHVPVWSRACARDTTTLARLPHGRPGFLHLVSPYITSSPAHSLVMGDLAALHPASSCGCGLATDWIELHGRAGTRAARGCAVAASELIEES